MQESFEFVVQEVDGSRFVTSVQGKARLEQELDRYNGPMPYLEFIELLAGEPWKIDHSYKEIIGGLKKYTVTRKIN